MPTSLTIFIFGVGGYSATEKSQSAKICLNFYFRGGGFCNWKVTKCQDLPKLLFSGGVEGGILQLKSHSAKICLNFYFGGGGILQLKSQSANISDNFHFRGGGRGYSATEKSQSAKICLNFYFRGGVFCNWKVTKWGQNAKISDNFHFRRVGGFSATEKSKCQHLWQFLFSGGGGILQLKSHKVPRSA